MAQTCLGALVSIFVVFLFSVLLKHGITDMEKALVYMHGEGILLFIFIYSEYRSTSTDSLVHLKSAARGYARSLSKCLQFSVDVL